MEAALADRLHQKMVKIKSRATEKIGDPKKGAINRDAKGQEEVARVADLEEGPAEGETPIRKTKTFQRNHKPTNPMKTNSRWRTRQGKPKR